MISENILKKAKELLPGLTLLKNGIITENEFLERVAVLLLSMQHPPLDPSDPKHTCTECELRQVVERQGTMISKMRDEITRLLQRRDGPLPMLQTLYGIPLEHFLEFLDKIAEKSAEPAEKILRERAYSLMILEAAVKVVIALGIVDKNTEHLSGPEVLMVLENAAEVAQKRTLGAIQADDWIDAQKREGALKDRLAKAMDFAVALTMVKHPYQAATINGLGRKLWLDLYDNKCPKCDRDCGPEWDRCVCGWVKP